MVTNKSTDFTSLNFETGETLLIDKPSGWTSFKVVHNIKRTITVKRVGHTGTLDPLATGLLIVLTGRDTKQMVKYQDLDKTYTGIILLGKTSPSMDTETEMIYHGGNFHGDYVALEMDKLKLAVTKMSMLIERQLNYLVNHKLNEIYPPFLNA